MSRDIKLLKPELQEIVVKFLDKCEAEGLKVLITQTFRSKAEQDEIYAKGRTAFGDIVTNVRYPNSSHCWGIAFDFCQNIKGKEFSDASFFAKVGEIGKSFGLEWGGDWKNFKDMPHLQLPLKVSDLIVKYQTPSNYIKSWEVLEKVDAKSNKPKTNEPSEWAKLAWDWAIQLKLIDGINPQGNLTREQLMVILKRFADK